jgi:dimethylhistidine N-methyltransferase
MAVTATNADNVSFEDQQPATTDSLPELLSGLQREQKQINPRFFYDAHGSELFEQITRLDEYYPTRVERSILSDNAREIAHCCGDDCVLIEPGSGSSEKVRLLLETLRPAAYVPLDISSDFLYESALKLGREYPWLPVYSICADFSSSWQERTRLPAGRRVVFYPGSTIGNLEPGDAQVFLASLRPLIGEDGGVLVGVDLHKSEDVLNAAYNDAEGVTAAFNLNILNTVNSLTGSDFRLQGFSHRAFYNEARRRIEMHLVSKESQHVKVNGSVIEFLEGESLHTENSYKYSIEGFQSLSQAAGFTVARTWCDENRLFSVHYLTVAPDSGDSPTGA